LWFHLAPSYRTTYRTTLSLEITGSCSLIRIRLEGTSIFLKFQINLQLFTCYCCTWPPVDGMAYFNSVVFSIRKKNISKMIIHWIGESNFQSQVQKTIFMIKLYSGFDFSLKEINGKVSFKLYSTWVSFTNITSHSA
jgi:hypothetical protein